MMNVHIENEDGEHVGKMFASIEEAHSSARKLANRYHKKYYVVWFKSYGRTISVVMPDEPTDATD